ncbi:MAG TPA: glycoside hydrolase family 57 protein [Candidatus Norongarragalinales archaeon]|nr:glycoside hydrolase family 57 protein [Candidatus Norongarragalinales archaeon]
MTSICLYFHIHQPIRLNKFSLFHEGRDLSKLYFNTGLDQHYFEKAKAKCYDPTNRLLLRLVEENYGRFKFSFSVTGTYLEQAQKTPAGREVIESLQQLSSTGKVEFLGETYYHSLASLFPTMDEFESQVRQHDGYIRDLFSQTPKVFRNTEVIYSNRIASEVEKMGYKGILTEGIEWVLGWRSPNYVYRNKDGNLGVLMRNYKLSDDIGYRFSARWWPEWPLTADKYASWLSAAQGQTVNIFMDYETFGEHHWHDTGILQFLRHLPGEALRHEGLSFKTCSETLESNAPVGEIDVPSNLSWADMERDVSAWLGNQIQQACFGQLEALGEKVRQTHDPELLHTYRLLQTSDHLYYLCTKSWADGDVHKHFSPYKENTPYDNFINYMNILQHFRRQVDLKLRQQEDERIATFGRERMLYIKQVFESPAGRVPEQNSGIFANAMEGSDAI